MVIMHTDISDVQTFMMHSVDVRFEAGGCSPVGSCCLQGLNEGVCRWESGEHETMPPATPEGIHVGAERQSSKRRPSQKIRLG